VKAIQRGSKISTCANHCRSTVSSAGTRRGEKFTYDYDNKAVPESNKNTACVAGLVPPLRILQRQVLLSFLSVGRKELPFRHMQFEYIKLPCTNKEHNQNLTSANSLALFLRGQTSFAGANESIKAFLD
jgi:hypothetical protein